MTRERNIEGLRQIGHGRRAEVFEWSAGSVLKLARDPGDVEAIANEARLQEAAYQSGAPVAAVLERGTFNGRPGFVMERLEGPDLLSVAASRPWQVLRIGRELGVAHMRLHAAAVPPGLPTFHDAARRRLNSPLVPEPLREGGLELLERLPPGDRVVHGDFHPGNLVRTRRGVMVIDFANAAVGDPLADFAITTTILGMGEPPPGTSRVERLLTAAARRAVLGSYRRTYRPRGDPGHLSDWVRLFLTMRLADGIPEERRRILRRLGHRQP